MNLAQSIGQNRVILAVSLALDVCLLLALAVLNDLEWTLDDLVNAAGPKGHAGLFLAVLILGAAVVNLSAIWVVWSDRNKPT